MYTLLSVVALLLSLAGNLLVNLKHKSGFVIWSLSNIAWIAVNITGVQKNMPQIVMFLVYIVLNVHGYLMWRTNSSKETVLTVGGSKVEREKTAVLRVVNTIYSISLNKLVTIHKTGNTRTYKCVKKNGVIQLICTTDPKRVWGVEDEDINNFRKYLLQDFLEGFFYDIEIVEKGDAESEVPKV